jgi:hypothetical protein
VICDQKTDRTSTPSHAKYVTITFDPPGVHSNTNLFQTQLGQRVAAMNEAQKSRGFKRVKTQGGIVREFEMKVGKKEQDKRTEGRSRLDKDRPERGKRRKAKF